MPAEDDPGFGVFGDWLASARPRLRAAAPDTAAAQDADGFLLRLVSAALDDACLAHLRRRGGLTQALAVRGAPNPHYRLWHAALDPGRHYRLEGRLLGSERIGIAAYAGRGGAGMQRCGHQVITPRACDATGRFLLTLAADADPTTGIRLTPDSRILLVRVLHRTPVAPAARLVLEGAGEPPGLPHAAQHPVALARALQSLDLALEQTLDWARETAARPNALYAPPEPIADAVRSEPDTTYALGYFELGAGQWLDAQVGPGLHDYWSLHAYSHWGESLGRDGIHDRNAVRAADGSVRIAIGPSCGSAGADIAPNHLDTADRLRGMLVFRALGPVRDLPTARRRP